jgi:hypothetical protein
MSEPIALDAVLACELAAKGQHADGWTVICDEPLGSGRWTEERRLVIQDHGRRYFAAIYERDLTQTPPGVTIVGVGPVVERVRAVEVTDYVPLAEVPNA